MITTRNIWAQLRNLVFHNVWRLAGTGAPVDGAAGTGATLRVGGGSTYTDDATGIIYQNISVVVGTPVWVAQGNVAIAGKGGDLTFRRRCTTAEINAGVTLLPAIVGWKYRVNDMTMIAVGGAAGAATAVRIKATQAAGVVLLLSTAIAALTQSAVVRAGAANASVIADGASFIANDVNTAIIVDQSGAALTTATAIDIIINYSIER